MGTHISIPKGCTGTYLWGADEISKMQVGNRRSNEAFGGDAIPTPPPDASDATLTSFLRDKYERRRWAVRKAASAPPSLEDHPDLISFPDDAFEPTPPAIAAAGGGADVDFFGSWGL